MNIEELSIATIRSLCIDMINKAKSGHPGVALGAAPILYTLYTRHIVANPNEPNWINRDRLVLSCGHGSSLLYAMLHVAGYGVSIEDIKAFRQLGSITPGHPETEVTPGVDAPSGPLGQGISQAVGLAMAEIMLQNNYVDGNKLCNHYTYVVCGDGCLHEGISQEAISFAGHQKLNKLILLYDSNNITLDGKLSDSFSDDTELRFKSAHWNVIKVNDGNNVNEIDNAIKEAKKSQDKPTIIIVNTVIGFGASKAGTNKVHGAPIGEEDGKHTKVEVYHFDHEDFYVPEEVKEHFKNTFIARGVKAYEEYQKVLEEYGKKHPIEQSRFIALQSNDLSNFLPKELPEEYEDNIATRKSSQKALNDYAHTLTNLYGGSADVAGSVMTSISGETYFLPESRQGHSIAYGIREFAMGSINNGILLHGGIRVYGGSFLVFSDYMRASIRMAALYNLPNIYLFSHDSIAVGEDGPTHEPVEHVAALRIIPNMSVIRPCDERETYAAWQVALRSTKTPTAIILSRQNLPLLESSAEGLYNGAYIISKANKPSYEIVATGSEVSLAINAQKLLKEAGVEVSVISMPSWELFEKTSDEYKKSVFTLPKSKRISIEMLSSFGWDRYADHHIAIDVFGKSGKASDLIKYFKFTPEDVKEFVLNIK